MTLDEEEIDWGEVDKAAVVREWTQLRDELYEEMTAALVRMQVSPPHPRLVARMHTWQGKLGEWRQRR
jgi:hypothetical protein